MQIIFNFLHIYYAGVSTMIKKYRFFAEFYEHGENNGLTCLRIQINKTVVFSITHK